MFLTERAHIVHGGTRKQDKFYWCNLGLIVGFAVIFVCCLIWKIAESTPDSCIITIKRSLDVSFIVYDFVVNAFLTIQFLVPLLKSSSMQGRIWRRIKRLTGANLAHQRNILDMQPSASERRLYTLAKRTFIGGFCCTLITILANSVQVAVMYGKEEAWLCLSICSGDVVLNCIVLHLVSSRRRVSDGPSEQVSNVDNEALIRPKLRHRASSEGMQQKIDENSVRHVSPTTKSTSPTSVDVEKAGFVELPEKT